MAARKKSADKPRKKRKYVRKAKPKLVELPVAVRVAFEIGRHIGHLEAKVGKA